MNNLSLTDEEARIREGKAALVRRVDTLREHLRKVDEVMGSVSDNMEVCDFQRAADLLQQQCEEIANVAQDGGIDIGKIIEWTFPKEQS